MVYPSTFPPGFVPQGLVINTSAITALLPNLPGYVVLPPEPGSPIPPPGMHWVTPNPLNGIYIGQTAFNQITAKFYDLRAMLPNYPSLNNFQMTNEWFMNNASDLKQLAALILPLPVSQITGMLSWLGAIEPGRVWSPKELVTLVDKIVLKQNVAFPEVELPARVLRFLSSALSGQVRSVDIQTLQNQLATLRTQEYALMKSLIISQGDLDLLIKETWVSSNTTQGDYDTQVAYAKQQLAIQQSKLPPIRDQIVTLNAQIANLYHWPLPHDQLASFIVNNLSDNTTVVKLGTDIAYRNNTFSAATQLLAPLTIQLAQLNIDRMPAFNELLAARANYNTITNYGRNLSADIGGAATARLAYATDQNQIWNDRITVTNSQIANQIKTNPLLFPNGKWIDNTPASLATLVDLAIDDLCKNNPADLLTLTNDAMTVLAKSADDRSQALISERQTATAEKQELLQTYVENKIEEEMKYYQDQMTNAQYGYNQLNQQINDMVSAIQAIQDQVSTNFQALGKIIGWWANVNHMTTEQMAHPSFINQSLNAVSNLNGKYDKVDIPLLLGMTSTQVFWEGTGSSSEMASDTLFLMQKMEEKNQDYKMKSPKMIEDMKNIQTWMTQIQTAWKFTSDRINSPEYVQTATREFNSNPLNALIQSDIDSVAAPLREISVNVSTYQQTLKLLLEDIEVASLNGEGINFYDPAVLTYEQKKHAWIGTDEFLEKSQNQLPFLQQMIQDIAGRIANGSPDPDDADHLNVAKQGVTNIMAAQLLYRKLANDTDFQMALKLEAESASKAQITDTQSVGTK
jgi:hypothetical protein